MWYTEVREKENNTKPKGENNMGISSVNLYTMIKMAEKAEKQAKKTAKK